MIRELGVFIVDDSDEQTPFTAFCTECSFSITSWAPDKALAATIAEHMRSHRVDRKEVSAEGDGR